MSPATRFRAFSPLPGSFSRTALSRFFFKFPMNNKRNIKGGIALFIGITLFELFNNRDSLFLLWHLNVVALLSARCDKYFLSFLYLRWDDGLQKKSVETPRGNGERRESYLSSSIQICPALPICIWFRNCRLLSSSWTNERMRCVSRQRRRIDYVGVGGPITIWFGSKKTIDI